jgi:Flp pilus assembly protein TadD
MKKRTIILTIAFVTFGTLCYSQVKETVKNDEVDNQMTISETGMYDGTDSEEAKKYFDQAVKYGNEEDFNNAKKFYLKAIKADSKYVEAYDNLGLIYRRLEDFDKAIEYYNKSIKLFPKGQMAHQNLAAVYGIKKDYKSAINEYEAILEISPNDPEGYFGIANSYMMLSQFDDALINAKKALDLYEKINSPHIGDGYYMVGLINYYKGDNENAKKYLKLAKDKGAKIHPQIEEELFSKESEKQIQLKTKEDYAKYEQDVINGYNWLMKTPIDMESTKRKETNAFLMQWITGSPNVSIELSEKIVTYMDCGDCLMMFMGGWTKYALESKDFKNKVKGNLAGTEGVIEFYLSNKNSLGKNKAIEKFIKLKEENKLEEYIKSNI